MVNALRKLCEAVCFIINIIFEPGVVSGLPATLHTPKSEFRDVLSV